MSANFEELFTRVGTDGARGKYDAMLDGETRAVLDGFTEWLVAHGKTVATSKSYRSYVAKALAVPAETLTSDQRSGIKAFRRYLEDQ